MAMSKASYNYNRKSWEDAEFPILCQTCLGDNPYLRMMKEKYGKACTICDRPFTTFRWCPGKGMRYKKTEVCQTCAKLKNVCQTCLLDLEYGLPVQVRDYALQIQDEMPKTGANRDFYVQNAEMAMAESGGTTPGGTVGRVMAREGPNELLMKLARTTPYYQRNRPHICSFWVKGECKRGEECPYRHEKPTDPDDPLSDQNIKDRYYGTLDPVAEKMLNRAKAIPVLKPPEDQTITTLYVGNLGEEGYLSEQDLQDYFYQFGEIRSISLLPGKGCGFVQFTSRGAAELAAERTFNKLTLKRRRITVRWGKPQAQQNLNTGLAAAMPGSSGVGYGLASYAAVPGLPGTLPAPANLDFFNLATAGSLPKEDEEDGPSTAKRSRAEIAPPENLDAPAPVKPKTGQAGYAAVAPPTDLVRHSANAPPTIHYPSQDPHHLGAKDLQD